MPNFRFFYNLRPETYNARVNGFVDPEGYLLSVHRYTAQLIKFVLTLGREHGELIFADSGLFSKIQLVMKAFQPEANTLIKNIRSLEANLGHSIRPNEVPDNLRKKYYQLATNIAKHIKDVEMKIEPTDIVRQQQLIEPERFICMEDLLMAVLVGLSIEPEYLKQKRSYYSRRNKRAVGFYNKTMTGTYGSYIGEPYAVASSVNYNSALDAGRAMAKGGVTHLAMGFGAYMSDDSYVDYFMIGRKIHKLNGVVPRRYLRTILAVRGLIDGYLEISGKHPHGLHMLGLGAPIMILIVSLVASKIEEVSYDATSPIKDAYEGTVYFTRPAYVKTRCRTLALLFCRNPEKKWWCKCSYCKHYLQKYPLDAKRAANWYERQGQPKKINTDHLHGNTELTSALPMFGEPKGGQLRKDVNDWRIGHNHLMLERLFKDLNIHKGSNNILQFVKNEVSRYYNHTTKTYADAIRISLAIAMKQI